MAGLSLRARPSSALLCIFFLIAYVLYTFVSFFPGEKSVLRFSESNHFYLDDAREQVMMNGRWDSTLSTSTNLPPSPLFRRAILVMTSRRCDYVDQVLGGIVASPLARHYDLLVSYDGLRVDDCVAEKFSRFRPSIKEIFYHEQAPEVKTPLMRLSNHYRFALERVFMKRDYDYCVVFEDDIVPQADFFSYFLQAERLFRADPTLAVINSANHHSVRTTAFNPYHFYRMDSFNTYGFMLPRDKYLEYAEQLVENEHVSWDYNLDCMMRLRGYSSISPELSRSRHIGEKGTTASSASNLRARMTAMSQLPEGTYLGDLSYLLKDNYDKLVSRLIQEAVPHSLTPDVASISSAGAIKLIFSRTKAGQQNKLWKSLGIYTIFEPNYLGVLITHNTKATTLVVVDQTVSLYHPVTGNLSYRSPSVDAMVSRDGESCTSACGRIGQTCQADRFRSLNNCQSLQKAFGCSKCMVHYEPSPGYQLSHLGEVHSGYCIVYLDWYFDAICELQIPSFQRLCPCH